MAGIRKKFIVLAGPGKKHKTAWKIAKAKRAVDLSQMTEYLPSKCEAQYYHQ
jgi:hypothetical protein